MKYQLLLKDIMKYTERAGDRTEILQKAQQVLFLSEFPNWLCLNYLDSFI